MNIILFSTAAPTEIYTLSLHDALPIYHPGQGDPVRRENRRLVAAHPGGDKQRGRRRTGDQAGDPAGDAETSGDGHDAEQGGCGEHPRDRREPDRRQRAFVREPNRRRAFVRTLNGAHRVSVSVAYLVIPDRDNGSVVTLVHRGRPRPGMLP